MESPLMSFVEELKRRNVFRVAIAYVIIAWLLLQVGDTLAPALHLPESVNTALAFFLILGFPLALFLAWAYELTPEGLKKEKDVDRTKSITHVTSRKLDYVTIAVLILALGYFAFDKFMLDPLRDTELVQATTELATKSGKEQTNGKSIAVLPFVNMSDDTGNEYFSDGISEEILNALAKVEGLKVAGRTSSFAFKGRNEDLRTIGEALGVSHILEGSVRKAGVKVRITAQLIKADDGFHLWSDTYDRELTDVFAIQDEIAQAIFNQLQVHLTIEQGDIRFASSTADPEAFDLYLEARQKIYIRRRAPLEEAAELLDRAIAIDPGYAPAHAQRGITHMLLSDRQYGTIPAAEAYEQAKLMLDQALSLDLESAEAWAGRGLYLFNMGDHEQASEALRRALAINPSLVNARNWLANSLLLAGDLEGSYRARQEVLVRDPLYLPGINNLMDDYFLYGDVEKAQALLDRVRPYVPASRILVLYEGVLHFVAGRVAESLPYFESAHEMDPEIQATKGTFSRALLYSWQNERLAEVGLDEYRVYALMRLDRPEEASILARELAAIDNNIAALFRLLVEQGHHAELIDYVESRWPDLQAFEADFPERDGWSEHNYLGQIAFCYQRLGNQEKFQEALSRYKATLDYQRRIGANNHSFAFAEAVYAVLAGDHETALSKLERAFEGGFTVNPKLSKTWPMFEPLDGGPRFEVIIDRMVEHLNSERAKMGLALL
jgi:TolB-like protein/tetratricopeptide (TPR) repeat protein